MTGSGKTAGCRGGCRDGSDCSPPRAAGRRSNLEAAQQDSQLDEAEVVIEYHAGCCTGL
jgi:hypothetical protein